MIKTVVIVNDFDYIQGGASKIAIDTACMLNKEGYNVIFFSGTHSEDNYVNYGYKNVTLNLPESLKDKNKLRGALRGLYNVKAKKEFKKLLENLDPDTTLIHFHGWTKTLSSSVFLVAFKKKIKTILTLHDYFISCPNGGLFNYPINNVCKLKGNSFKCICTNCDSRNYFIKIYRNIRYFIQNNIVKIPKRINNIIYISDFSWKILNKSFPENINTIKINNPIDIPTKKNISNLEKNKYYLYVGRVSKEKSVETFCKAISDMNLEGIVVGDGNEKEKLESLYPKIKFVGWKNKNEVFSFMLKAKALIFTSKWYETAGLTALEANSIGLPCIVRDDIATSDFICHNKNGMLFKDDKDLINVLKDYQSKNSKELKEMSKYSILYARNFNTKKYKNDLINFYNKI